MRAEAPDEDERAPQWIEIRGNRKPSERIEVPTRTLYHDLGKRHPEPPVSVNSEEVVVHRCHLHGLSGISELMNWVADGDVAIVEMAKVMERRTELVAAVERLMEFVVGDLGGQVLQIGDSRLLLLPEGIEASEGLAGA